jgi:hypothetical protein
MENLGRYLNITNEGDEVRPLRGWPDIAQEDADASRTWFDKEWVVSKSLYDTIKTSMEQII